jgi:hypothetical protein
MPSRGRRPHKPKRDNSSRTPLQAGAQLQFETSSDLVEAENNIKDNRLDAIIAAIRGRLSEKTAKAEADVAAAQAAVAEALALAESGSGSPSEKILALPEGLAEEIVASQLKLVDGVFNEADIGVFDGAQAKEGDELTDEAQALSAAEELAASTLLAIETAAQAEVL